MRRWVLREKLYEKRRINQAQKDSFGAKAVSVPGMRKKIRKEGSSQKTRQNSFSTKISIGPHFA